MQWWHDVKVKENNAVVARCEGKGKTTKVKGKKQCWHDVKVKEKQINGGTI